MENKLVTSKLESFVATDPLAALRAEDPWREFREIEKIELHWEQTYRHSLGKYSKFFLALEAQKLLATRCAHCDKVWLPPRPACADCLRITHWVELSGVGTLRGFSALHSAPAFVTEPTPYVLAYVQLDGAHTLFAHLLKNYGAPDNVQYGLCVKVVFATQPVAHPLHLMWFEPVA